MSAKFRVKTSEIDAIAPQIRLKKGTNVLQVAAKIQRQSTQNDPNLLHMPVKTHRHSAQDDSKMPQISA